MKLHKSSPGNFAYHCPGCGYAHLISTIEETAHVNPDGTKPVWGWNGSMDFPTFTPSVLVVDLCHHFVTNGMLDFLGDSKHALAGQHVPIPDWELPTDWANLEEGAQRPEHTTHGFPVNE